MLKRFWAVAAVVVIAEGLATGVARAADNYGAIATSVSTEAYGFSYDYPTRAGAEKRAFDECAARADDCQVRVWFKNTCAAVAHSDEYVAWGLGNTRARAESTAMRKLKGDGKIIAWSCTTR